MVEEPVVKGPEVVAALADIREARHRLGEAISRLKQGDRLNPLNVRRWFQRHPVESALGAAAAGFLLAQPGRSSREGGDPGTLLGNLSGAGIESILPFLLKTLL